MTVRKDLMEFASEIIIPKFVLHMEQPNELAPDKLNELTYSLLEKINDDLLERYIAQQNEGDKGPLLSISASTLRSSAYTQTHYLKLSANEKELFLETEPTAVFWVPEFLISLMNEELEQLNRDAKKKLIRLSKWDMEMFRLEYARLYAGLTLAFISTLSERVFELPQFQKIDKRAQVSFYVGEYLQPHLLAGQFSLDLDEEST